MSVIGYLQLLWSFFQIGLFSMGGGYAALPLIQNQIVDLHHWMDMTVFTDIITISQMTPGAIALNAATFVGIQLGGIVGAIVATVGCVLPSFISVLIFTKLYYKYRSLSLMKGIMYCIRPAVVALIASAGLDILILAFWKAADTISLTNIDVTAVVLFLAAIILLRWKKVNQIYVMLGTGIVGGLFLYFTGIGQ